MALVVLAESLLLAAQEPLPPLMAIRFADVGAKAGLSVLNLCGGARKDYLVEIACGGAAFLDYDNDGDQDVVIVNGSTFPSFHRGGDPLLTLYANNGKGKFADVTARARLASKGWGMGVCAADYDNDGFEDFYVTAYGPNVLFHNQGDGTFADVTARARVGDARWSTGCAFGDYDRDGWVDLYVANYVREDDRTTPTHTSFCQYMGMEVLCGPRGLPGEADVLYRNNGDGTFTDVTEAAGLHDPGHYGFGVLFTDLDNDGWPDIYVANDSNPNFLFRNQRDGSFREVALEAGAALSEEGRAQAGMGVEAGDYNHDGWLDLIVANFSQDYNTLYQNNGDGTFRDVSSGAGLVESSLPYLAWGIAFADLDNDGWLDLVVANGHIYPEIDHFPLGSTFLERNLLYQNLGNGRFREVGQALGGPFHVAKSSRGLAVSDYDNDGDLDLLIIELNDRPTLLRNQGGNRRPWVTLRLRGTRSNRDALGARVRLTAAGRTQTAEVRSGGSYLSQHDKRLHFGLGEARQVDRLEVRWPSGQVEVFEKLPANQFFLLTEGQGIAPEPLPGPTKKR